MSFKSHDGSKVKVPESLIMDSIFLGLENMTQYVGAPSHIFPETMRNYLLERHPNLEITNEEIISHFGSLMKDNMVEKIEDKYGIKYCEE